MEQGIRIKSIFTKYFFSGQMNIRWAMEFVASLLLPAAILLGRPLNLTFRQSAVVACVLLVIIWWSSGIVKKIPASIFLLLMFCIISGAKAQTIFSFPLSETFPMIIITYLFSQGISNAGLIDKIFQPVLLKFVHTPCQCLVAITAMFYLTMYVIPQPLARLIIVATVFYKFLSGTDIPEKTRSVLMYGVFLLYTVVNNAALDADMIMNYTAVSFASTPISNEMWVHYMFLPTLVTCLLICLLFIGLFHKEMLGVHLTAKTQEKTPFTRQQTVALIVIGLTVVLWMTHSIHGINNTLITIVATAILFGIGILHKEDWKTIDVTTLIFLSAAFAIGGVMQSCGAADKVFGVLQGIFPETFSAFYLVIMVLVSMVIHLILGSNTTTLSVVVPGMSILCGQVVSAPVVVFTAILSVSFHAILPFHSVAIMIGSSNGYFSSKQVVKMGIPMTLLIYFLIVCVYLPYWYLTGLL